MTTKKMTTTFLYFWIFLFNSITLDVIPDKEFENDTLTRLTRLEEQVKRIPEIDMKLSAIDTKIDTKFSIVEKELAKIIGILEERSKNNPRIEARITDLENQHAKIIGIQEEKNKSEETTRANLNMWLTIGTFLMALVAFFRKEIFDWIRTLKQKESSISANLTQPK